MGFGFTALQSIEAQSLLAGGPKKFGRSIDPLNPFAVKVADFTPRAQSVIFLFMVGGP